MRPVHPGEILFKEFIKPLDLLAHDFAHLSGLSESNVHRIVNGTLNIDRTIAHALARGTGTDPVYWLNLQENYNRQQRS